MKKADRLYWLRIGLAVLSAVISIGVGLNGENPMAYMGVLIAMAMYGLSVYLAKSVIRLRLPRDQRRKLYTIGIGSYAMIFLFTWILLNTLLML